MSEPRHRNVIDQLEVPRGSQLRKRIFSADQKSETSSANVNSFSYKSLDMSLDLKKDVKPAQSVNT